MGKRSKRESPDNLILRREKHSFTQKSKILIVTEDSKHMPAYFEALREFYSLSRRLITILPSDGSAPISVVETAQKYLVLDAKQNDGNTYDFVFCVFDRDAHKSFDKALRCIEALSSQIEASIEAVCCVPSFEFWVLCHFEKTTGYMTQGEVIKRIKKYIPKFNKKTLCYRTVFQEHLFDKLDTAESNSKWVCMEQEKTNTDNPKTTMHHILECFKTELGKGRC